MAGSVASAAETSQPDPMDAHRSWTKAHVQTMMVGGLTQQAAMMDAMAKAQTTGDAAIVEVVRQTCETLPAVDLAQ